MTVFAAYLAFGQVSLVVEPSKKEILQNEPLVLNFYLEIKGNGLSQETPLRLVDTSKFTVLSSSSEQSSFKDPRTGIIVYQMVYQYILMPRKTGKIKIGSSSVVVDNKLYYTEPFDILVKESERRPVVAERNSRDLYLNVEVEDEAVYQNQPTVAILRAYSKNIDDFRKVKNIKLPSEDQFDVKAVSFAKSEIEPAGNIASQVLAVFLIFPLESGRVELPPVVANISRERKIVSNKTHLTVKKLPAKSPADYKNAVGNFKLKLTPAIVERAEVEKPVKVSLTLSGDGNLNNVKLPKIRKSKDYKVYNPHITSNIKSGKNGISGEVVANYVVVPKKSGLITVSTENFAYFNPATEKYVDVGEKNITLTAYTHDELIELQTPLERVNEYSNVVLETVNNPVIQTDQLKVQEKKKFQWSTTFMNLGVLLAAVSGFFLYRIVRKKRGNKLVAEDRIPVQNVTDKEEILREQFANRTEDHFAYLEVLKNERNYTKFFAAVEELDQEMISRHQIGEHSDFKSYLEKSYGSAIAAEYRSLQQQIQIEKYAPMHDDHQLDQLYDAVTDFYSKIRI